MWKSRLCSDIQVEMHWMLQDILLLRRLSEDPLVLSQVDVQELVVEGSFIVFIISSFSSIEWPAI